MTRVILILLLTVSFATKAQKRDILYGSWQSGDKNTLSCKDSTLDVRIIDNRYKPFILTINKDNRGNISDVPYNDSLLEYEENIVRIKRKKIIIHNRKTINSLSDLDFPYYYNGSTLKYHYKFLSDSEIVINQHRTYDSDIDETDYECSSEFRLKKINNLIYPRASDLEDEYNKKLNKIFSNRIYLMKMDSSFKIVELKAGGILQIHTELFNTSSGTTDNTDYYIDAIGQSFSDSMQIHPIREVFSSYNNEGYQLRKERFSNPFILSSKMQAIKTSEISYISYTRPIENKIHKTARVFGWLSLTTAILVAPLISIDYKHGDFNKNLYFNTAGYSLGLMAISITVSKLTNGTQYLIGKRYSKKGWIFTKKNTS